MTEQASNTSKEKLHEALRLANEGIKEMSGDAREAVVDRYHHLKEAFQESEVNAKLQEANQYCGQKAREMGAAVDESVKAQPYYFIAGAFIAGVALGIYVGRKV